MLAYFVCFCFFFLALSGEIHVYTTFFLFSTDRFEDSSPIWRVEPLAAQTPWLQLHLFSNYMEDKTSRGAQILKELKTLAD